MFNIVLLLDEISTVWITIWIEQEKLEETLIISLTDEFLANKIKLIKFKINCNLNIGIYLKLSCYTNIGIYLNITKYL